MPKRPTLTLDTVRRMDEFVNEQADVPPTALDTEDKILFVLKYAERQAKAEKREQQKEDPFAGVLDEERTTSGRQRP